MSFRFKPLFEDEGTMPHGICAECGLEALGPGLVEEEAFLCCDCDIELQAYSSKERQAPQLASSQRAELAFQLGAKPLPIVSFAPGGEDSLSLEVHTDEEQEVFAGVGTRIWPASVPLALYLLRLLCSGDLASPLSVVELGAGCGQVGLWLWLSAASQCLRICLTDVPRLCPLLSLNANRAAKTAGSNSESRSIEGREVVVRPLRWGLDEDLEPFQGEPWDLVIGADICYNEDKVEPLLATLTSLRPRHGAIFCLSLCKVRGPGAWALQDQCQADGWAWTELCRETAAGDGQEVLLVHINPPTGIAPRYRDTQVLLAPLDTE